MPEFRVLEIEPGPRTGCWTYASARASAILHEDCGRLEFFVLAPAKELQHVELLTMVAWYHKTRGLGWGHTFPLGHPWIGGSLCDHMFISTPFPFGPDLEICNFDNDHAHLFWLLPITEAERDFKRDHGIEALERRFEDAAIEYWEPLRASVV